MYDIQSKPQFRLYMDDEQKPRKRGKRQAYRRRREAKRREWTPARIMFHEMNAACDEALRARGIDPGVSDYVKPKEEL